MCAFDFSVHHDYDTPVLQVPETSPIVIRTNLLEWDARVGDSRLEPAQGDSKALTTY